MATVDEILAARAYAVGDETWTVDGNYPSYRLYVEPEYVPVTNKRIADFNDQISVRGEQNAQFVGFQLPRYDDGLDLTAQHLYIHYQTVYGGGDGVPCNVSKSDNYVRMCWKIPAQATQEPGTIQMMIYATGTNSAGERVTWKTLPASYTIHDGLDIGGGIPEPDQSWYEQFVAQMEGKVSTAQRYANDAQASKTAAAGSATASAQSATASAQALEDNKAYVESQKETFVGYNKRETDLKYANALIGSASGTTQVTVDDAWEAPIPGLEISGKSEQFSTTGAQLLDLSAVSKSAGGAVINTADGGYQISGTGTLTEAFSASYQLDYFKNHLKPGNLILKSELTMPKLYIRIWDGSTVLAEMQGNSTKQITQEMLNNENVRVEAFLYGNTGSTITPGTYHPMLYQDGDGTWEPYTGGRPSPSPDNPQEIVSTDVTAVTVTGAQVIPYPYHNATKTSDGITFTDMGNGGIKVTGTSTKQYITFIINNNLFLPPGIYTKNVSEEFGLVFQISRYINNKYDTTAVGPNNKTFDTSSWDYNKYEYHVLIQVAKSDLTFNTIFYPMINRGDTALPWEPYRSKTAAIALAEPLRGIGDVRDRIMCKDGVWGVERAINQIDDTGTVPISEALEVLAVPTWEPLPSDTQAALNALTAYTGRTTITVTAEGPEPDVAVEYAQDTRMVIADLQAQINEIRNGGTT